jgi:hypothetical protein
MEPIFQNTITQKAGPALRSKRGTYAYVTNETRGKLIYLIEVEQRSIQEVCEELHMKYTTAKSILSHFNK